MVVDGPGETYSHSVRMPAVIPVIDVDLTASFDQGQGFVYAAFAKLPAPIPQISLQSRAIDVEPADDRQGQILGADDSGLVHGARNHKPAEPFSPKRGKADITRTCLNVRF